MSLLKSSSANMNYLMKGEEINTEEVPLLKTKRSSKSAKSKKAATVVQSTDLEFYSSDFREDENSTPEGRVFRSGRSTPVCTETSSGKEKSVSQKPISQRKTKENAVSENLSKAAHARVSFRIQTANASQALNVLVNQPQLAFQLLHTQGTNPTIPTVMTKAQPNPRLICPNPTTLPRNTTPSQQPTTLLTAPLNQRLFLPKITPPIDQLLAKTVSTTTPHVTGTVPTTSTNEIPNYCKFRPILPREPLGSPTFTLFNPPLQSLQNVVKATDTSSNVKQAIKRLVNSRTKNTDNPSQQQTTSLPDIASTFNKGFFTANSQSKPLIAPAQNNTEMASKEQAIKALLSIGSEQQTARQGKEGTTANVSASKETVPRKPDDMLVVFDTDKGIFKVGDVTIDPRVNTIGKESYTCRKCGKIFTSLRYLARHIKRVCPDMTHRKWKCDHCDKAFRFPFGLKQHVFTHTGERPHKCSQCPRAFYSSNDLRRHSTTHSELHTCICHLGIHNAIMASGANTILKTMEFLVSDHLYFVKRHVE